jgi:hypothetical protein
MTDIDARAFIKRRNPRTGASGLVPADQWADEFMSTLKDGQQVLVRVSRPRSNLAARTKDARPMTEIEARVFRKVRNPKTGVAGLVPCDCMADEFLASLPDGKEILVRISKPRSVRFLRLLFALLRKVVENTDRWANERLLLEDLKLATGLFETRVSALTGMPYPVPASISFASMNADEFHRWFDKAITVLARDVLNTAPDALRAEVMAMVEPQGRAA